MDEEDDGGGQICVLVDAVEMSEKKFTWPHVKVKPNGSIN